jgi:hypothetical protein
MSARPGPRGGYRVSGIPTAIVLAARSLSVTAMLRQLLLSVSIAAL